LIVISLLVLSDISCKHSHKSVKKSDITRKKSNSKLPDTYGRGVGYPWKFGDKFGSLGEAEARCEAAEKETGCE